MSVKSISIFLLAVCLFRSVRSASSSCSSLQLLADPSDCSSFYQCSAGEKHKISCPVGLQFNSDKNYCDWPENVKCTKETFVEQPSTENPTTQNQPTSSTTLLSTSTSTQTQPTTSTTVLSTSISTETQPTSTTVSSTTTSTTTEQLPTTTSSSLIENSSSCSTETSEPLTEELKHLRLSTCSLTNGEVEKVSPGRESNPSNVKVVESLLSQEIFTNLFPKADAAYTYTNFLKAVAKFPTLCTSVNVCKKILATMFAHFEQETAGLFYLKEINKSNYCATWSTWVKAAYPCAPGKQYYGRGSKQLSWNYNYGAFSVAMYGQSSVLLENPDLVSDTWLNFASAIWFFVTPQPPKPSMLHIVDGTWKPNNVDISAGLAPGFGASIMAINGAYECGSASNAQSLNRQKHYKRYCKIFGVNNTGEKLDCASMGKFSAGGSANPAIYWAPEQGCKLVRWQTAFSALVEGEHPKCKNAMSHILFYYFPFIFNTFI